MAGEIINLATFSLDTAKLQSSLDSLQNTYFDLRKAQKEYSDQSKEASKQIGDLSKENQKLSLSAGDNSKAIEANDKKIQSLLSTQRELFKSEQNLSTQMGTVKKEINQTTTQIKAYQDAEGKTKSLIDLGNDALGRQIKSKNDARAANAALNAVSNQLNPNIDAEAKLLVQLNAQIDKNTQFIKGNSSETTKQAMNIGNYASMTDNLSGILSKQGGIFSEVRTKVEGFRSTVSGSIETVKSIQNSLVGATQGMMGFKTSSQLAASTAQQGTVANAALATSTEGVAVAEEVATVATGGFASVLGVLLFPITAIVAVGLLLYNVFKDFAPVINPIKDAFVSLGAIFTVVKTGILDLVTGARSLKEVFSSLGSDIADATVETYKLEGAQRALKKSMDIQELSSARTASRVKELILQSKDLSKTVKERTDLINEAQGLEENEFKNRFKNYKTEKDLIISRIAVGKNLSDEDKKQLTAGNYEYLKSISKKKKLDSELVEEYKKNQLSRETLIQEDNQILEKAQNYKNKLIEKDQAKQEKDQANREKAAEKAGEDQKKRDEKVLENLLANSKASIDLFIAQQGFKRKSSEDEYNYNLDLEKRQLKDLQLRFEKKKITQKQFEVERLQITNDALAKNTELIINNAHLELDAQMIKNQKILENDKYLSDEQLRIKQEALMAQLTAETNYQALLLSNGKINQAEYDASIAIIKAESKVKADELEKVNKAAEQEKALIDLENQKIVDEGNFIAQAEIQKAQNAIKLEQELANVDKNGSEAKLIKEKYAEFDKQIEEDKQNNKLQLASQTFGNLAAIFGEESKAGKAFAIAQTTIDTYQSAVSAFKSMSGIPVVGPVLGGIAAAAAVASGLSTVKKITATKQPTVKAPSFASGVIGLRGSGSGTSDNISANLSAGESVINARSTSMFARELSQINQAGGGVGLNGASNILNQNELQSGANNSQLVSMIAEAVAIGSEAGTSKGAQSGIVRLSENRKIMSDAKF